MNQAEKSPVSIVIPNYNGEALLAKNIPAVIASLEHYSGGGEIVVVDDGSSDNSIEVLEKQFPTVRCIAHNKNQGFSEAVKTGIDSSNNELIFLLNSDVIPAIDCIAPLVERLSDNVFSVSPLILEEDGTASDYSCNLRRLKKGKFKAVNTTDIVHNKKTCYHLYSSGGSMLLKKSYFQKLGGFCDIYKPYYFEDFDLSIRAWRHGWKTIFEPASQVVHPAGTTIRKLEDRKKIKTIFNRNQLLLYWVHLSGQQLWLVHIPWQLLRLVEDILKIDKVRLRAFYNALTCLPEVWRLRKELSKQNLRSTESIVKELSTIT